MFKMRIPKLFKSVRYSLAVVNSLFLITGILLLIVGVATLVVFKEYTLLVTSKFFTLPNFVIATGVIIFFVAILGFYGALTEQFYFIAGYVALLLVVLVFEIAITTMGFKLQNDAATVIRRPMSQTLQLYGSRLEINVTWDNLQNGFQCCGVSRYTDWKTTSIPISCCHIDFGTISPFECTYDKSYEVGCASVLGEYLGYNAYVIGVTGAFIISLQRRGTVSTCTFFGSLFSFFIWLLLQPPKVLITAAGGWLAYRSRYEEVELES